jgi:hypothetical protein
VNNSLIRNRRDPSWRPTSGEGGSYKPMAKWNRAGRESEGFIVPLTPVDKAGRGKGPCFGRAGGGRKREGMVARPNNPIEKARQLQRRLYIAAKRQRKRRFHAWASSIWRRDVLRDAWNSDVTPRACMPDEKTIGKPDAGNPHVRFERGPQETEPSGHRA